MKHTPIAAAVALALAGCAAPKPAVDTTPENPTAVFETKVSSSGIAGNFPFETTEKRFVRSDMQRQEHATKGTGTFSGFLVTKMAGGPGDTQIARLDRKLMWTVSDKRKEYVECPIAGCPMPEQAQKPEARQEQPKQKTEEGCTMRVTSSQFNVKPSGQKKEVNGFNADQYQGAWVVRFQDAKKRTTTSTVNMDIWTTGLNEDMKKALDTEAAFGRTYLASVPRPQFPVPSGKAGEHPAVPPEVFAMMSQYLGNLSAADRASMQRALNELQKIKGHPVSTKLDWFLDGNACQSDEQQREQQSSQPKSATDALMSSAMGLFSKKEEKPAGPQPLLSFTVEVKQMGVVPVRDSTFNVPPTYKKVN
ncbi:MAG TPA: hypothetical protein VJQ58_00770 [Burkholderiales bacterium]|nr:hypothetical protein [Burkholderiales bacterium]